MELPPRRTEGRGGPAAQAAGASLSTIAGAAHVAARVHDSCRPHEAKAKGSSVLHDVDHTNSSANAGPNPNPNLPASIEEEAMSRRTARPSPGPGGGVAALRLEAIFHPKFENEAPDAVVRRRMLAGVSSGKGRLEASLKHSGSLLLWSGGQRFYSKNSAGTVVSRTGEVVLMRHFRRCHGADGWRAAYERCSAFVDAHRLTCAFEVVTSVLGHHGDLPRRDYLVLIAVADRGERGGGGGGTTTTAGGYFRDTAGLVRFAQRFRLPHNDAWVFASEAACAALFRAYDDLRETGTAATVVARLDRIVADDTGGGSAKVSSLCPHGVFQGDVLEGIVVRYVPYATSDEDGGAGQSGLREMKSLSAASEELLRLVPPSTKLDARAETTGNPDDDAIRLVDLRALAAMDDFEQQLESVLLGVHGPNLREVQRWDDSNADDEATATASINMVEIAEGILESSSANAVVYDRETLDIAQLIRALDRLKIAVSYKVLTEKTSGQERRLCILHVRNDSSFPKYDAHLKRERGGRGMPLFRGFSVELVPAADGGDAAESRKRRKTAADATTASSPGGAGSGGGANEEPLMLKLKFLPYMVRTFVCRNGLSVLRRAGVAGFESYAVSQLTKWRASDRAVANWMPFFRDWAEYCSSPPNASLPPLSENTYLHHYNEYEELFANGKYRSGRSEEPSFRGLIVVVGLTKNNLEAISLGMSKELRCSKIVRNVNKITAKDIVLSMQRSGGGLVCIAEIEDNYGKLRRLAKDDREAIHIVMVEGDLEVVGADRDRLAKIKGRAMGWRKVRCNMLLQLPKDAAGQKDADAALEYLRTDDPAKAVMSKLKESCQNNQADERPSLVVYFPSMPGSGKSSLCQHITANSLAMDGSRQLVLMEGDAIKQQGKAKFYDVARRRLGKGPAVAILDKNVPPSSFAAVHGLCVESESVAIPVLLEGMRDTVVGDGASSHVYPFSLQHLAACMSRVLRRPPKSHTGKLDSATRNACMIVVKFYCFYRNMPLSVLKEKLLSIGCRAALKDELQEKLVSPWLPFFREKELPDLPKDLESALEDAIIFQTGNDMNNGKAGGGDADMEKRLRSFIQSNQDFIDNLTVSLEESKEAFVSELSRVIASLPGTLDLSTPAIESKDGMIKIASLDFNYEQVHSNIIEDLKKSSLEVNRYFAEREKHKNNGENDKAQNRFITSVHCTFAHASQASPGNMISTFQHLLGTSVEVNAVSLLLSDKVAAIELEIPNSPSIPRPQNDFPHVTVWCAGGTEARESNGLPEKVKCNSAKRVAFRNPIAVTGVFSFWYS